MGKTIRGNNWKITTKEIAAIDTVISKIFIGNPFIGNILVGYRVKLILVTCNIVTFETVIIGIYMLHCDKKDTNR